MSEVCIAGVGMTNFGKHLERSLKDLTGDPLNQVLADAGCERGQIETAFFGNCVQDHMEGQDMVWGEIALRARGIEGVPVVNVENAYATASAGGTRSLRSFRRVRTFRNRSVLGSACSMGGRECIRVAEVLVQALCDEGWHGSVDHGH